jgi:sulfur-carrier protein adenylyltransferase/sulfurtransferase
MNERYSQQILLPEIGTLGQEQIDKAGVLVVGAGGLGTVVATYLVAMGVGKVGIADFDEVNETNLHRQFLYTPEEIGQKKALALAGKLAAQNNHVTVIPVEECITHDNFDAVISDYAIVCDCSDNLATRLVLDKQCRFHKVPLVHGAVSDWQGYVTLFHYKNQFQYRDLFDMETLLKNDSCAINGVSSPVCGMIGSIMANETIKIILNSASNLDGGLLYCNSLKNDFKLLKLKKQL